MSKDLRTLESVIYSIRIGLAKVSNKGFPWKYNITAIIFRTMRSAITFFL